MVDRLVSLASNLSTATILSGARQRAVAANEVAIYDCICRSCSDDNVVVEMIQCVSEEVFDLLAEGKNILVHCR